jgi:hypothetical protein
LDAYLVEMQVRLKRLLVLALAAAVAAAIGGADTASSRSKKPKRQSAEPYVTRDYDGTPIIMQGFRRTRPVQDLPPQADRPVHVPRGSSTYIPPPVPSPDGGPPAAALLRPPPEPYRPPPASSFGDRVTNCIHSFPLNAGVGNNPTDRQMYIRQCAN